MAWVATVSVCAKSNRFLSAVLLLHVLSCNLSGCGDGLKARPEALVEESRPFPEDDRLNADRSRSAYVVGRYQSERSIRIPRSSPSEDHMVPSPFKDFVPNLTASHRKYKAWAGKDRSYHAEDFWSWLFPPHTSGERRKVAEIPRSHSARNQTVLCADPFVEHDCIFLGGPGPAEDPTFGMAWAGVTGSLARARETLARWNDLNNIPSAVTNMNDVNNETYNMTNVSNASFNESNDTVNASRPSAFSEIDGADDALDPLGDALAALENSTMFSKLSTIYHDVFGYTTPFPEPLEFPLKRRDYDLPRESYKMPLLSAPSGGRADDAPKIPAISGRGRWIVGELRAQAQAGLAY